MHEAITIKKTETISLSSFNTTNWRAFSQKTGIRIKWIKKPISNETNDVEEYTWNNYSENHETQRQNYMSYLQKHFNLLPDISILDVANNHALLQLYNDPHLPFNLRGGTDVIFTDTAASQLPETGIRAVIELKKKIEPVNMYQTIMEMIVADIITTDDISVIGILTNLKDIWNIFWFDEKKVMGIQFTHRKSAIEFIKSMVLEKEWTTGKRPSSFSDNITVKRMKFDNMIEIEREEASNDIARMEDFYDEMTEEEIRRHKIGKAINIFKQSPLFAPFFFKSDNSSMMYT